MENALNNPVKIPVDNEHGALRLAIVVVFIIGWLISYIILNAAIPPEEREAAARRLRKMPRNSSAVRVRNRCELTGRPRGYFRKFGLSRLALRDLALQGYLPGVIKASW